MNTTAAADRVTTPPREHLDQVARALDAAGIEWALGGSALCLALGLVRRVGDWDLTTDAAPEAVEAALRGLEPAPELHGNSGIHADHKVVCFGGSVEAIARFAFFGDAGVIRIPTIVTGRWQGHPLGSPLAWAVAYTLMAGEKPGYDVKAERLFALAEARGRFPAAERDALLAQPLPEDVARRLSQG